MTPPLLWPWGQTPRGLTPLRQREEASMEASSDAPAVLKKHGVGVRAKGGAG